MQLSVKKGEALQKIILRSICLFTFLGMLMKMGGGGKRGYKWTSLLILAVSNVWILSIY